MDWTTGLDYWTDHFTTKIHFMVFMQPLCILRLPLLCRAVVRGGKGGDCPHSSGHSLGQANWEVPMCRCKSGFWIGGGGKEGTE